MWTPSLAGRTGPRYLVIADALAEDVRVSLGPPREHGELSRGVGVVAELLRGEQASGLV